MNVVGVDCATKKLGLARGSVSNGRITIHEVYYLSRENKEAEEKIRGWLERHRPALLALDAPLGWPRALGIQLHKHSAGMLLGGKADDLFSRETDRVVKSKIGKRPLEVGANLIARTAHSALELLERLRKKTHLTIPLAWEPSEIKDVCVIEVYPAATLRVLDIKPAGYKKSAAHSERKELMKALEKHLTIAEAERNKLEKSADMIDAVICVLAAADFLAGKCMKPENPKEARKEGWIWVRRPETGQTGVVA